MAGEAVCSHGIADDDFFNADGDEETISFLIKSKVLPEKKLPSSNIIPAAPAKPKSLLATKSTTAAPAKPKSLLATKSTKTDSLPKNAKLAKPLTKSGLLFALPKANNAKLAEPPEKGGLLFALPKAKNAKPAEPLAKNLEDELMFMPMGDDSDDDEAPDGQEPLAIPVPKVQESTVDVSQQPATEQQPENWHAGGASDTSTNADVQPLIPEPHPIAYDTAAVVHPMILETQNMLQDLQQEMSAQLKIQEEAHQQYLQEQQRAQEIAVMQNQQFLLQQSQFVENALGLDNAMTVQKTRMFSEHKRHLELMQQNNFASTAILGMSSEDSLPPITGNSSSVNNCELGGADYLTPDLQARYMEQFEHQLSNCNLMQEIIAATPVLAVNSLFNRVAAGQMAAGNIIGPNLRMLTDQPPVLELPDRQDTEHYQSPSPPLTDNVKPVNVSSGPATASKRCPREKYARCEQDVHKSLSRRRATIHNKAKEFTQDDKSFAITITYFNGHMEFFAPPDLTDLALPFFDQIKDRVIVLKNQHKLI